MENLILSFDLQLFGGVASNTGTTFTFDGSSKTGSVFTIINGDANPGDFNTSAVTLSTANTLFNFSYSTETITTGVAAINMPTGKGFYTDGSNVQLVSASVTSSGDSNTYVATSLTASDLSGLGAYSATSLSSSTARLTIVPDAVEFDLGEHGTIYGEKDTISLSNSSVVSGTVLANVTINASETALINGISFTSGRTSSITVTGSGTGYTLSNVTLTDVSTGTGLLSITDNDDDGKLFTVSDAGEGSTFTFSNLTFTLDGGGTAEVGIAAGTNATHRAISFTTDATVTGGTARLAYTDFEIKTANAKVTIGDKTYTATDLKDAVIMLGANGAVEYTGSSIK